MTYLEIILFGYAVNIASLILFVIITIIATIISATDETVIEIEQNKRYLELVEEGKELLKQNGKSTVFQEDFLMFVPFAYALNVIRISFKMMLNGINRTLRAEMINKAKRINERLGE